MKIVIVEKRNAIFVRDFIVFCKVALVLVGLGAAHYIGFLTGFPSEVLSLISLKFLAPFVSVFVFFMLFCFYLARTSSFVLSQFYYCFFAPIVVLLIRVARLNWVGKKKTARKIYREAALPEIALYWFFFVVVFLVGLNNFYIAYDHAFVSRTAKWGAVFLVVAAFLKTGVLNRPTKQISRIFDRRRIALRKRLFKEYVVFFSGVLVLISFYGGVLRGDMVMSERAIHVSGERYSGNVRVLLSSGSDFLAVDDVFYIYSTGGVLMKIPRAKIGSK